MTDRVLSPLEVHEIRREWGDVDATLLAVCDAYLLLTATITASNAALTLAVENGLALSGLAALAQQLQEGDRGG
jgi:hypothetical protein